MYLRIDDVWLTATVLCWVRLSAFFLSSPLSAAARAPISFVALLTLVLAGSFAAGQVSASMTMVPTSPLAWVLAVLAEVAIGTMLGFTLRCVMAAFTAAGQLVDLQMGLGIGAVFNPVTGGSSAATATALSLAALAYFFGVDGHLAAVRGLQFSLESVPPGTGWPLPPLEALLRPAGALFTLALVIAAPAVFLLLMIELAVMVVARVLPQMNVLFVAAPIKILAGFAALAISSPLIEPVAGRAYADTFRLWSEILR